jgi:hypothetical protein
VTNLKRLFVILRLDKSGKTKETKKFNFVFVIREFVPIPNETSTKSIEIQTVFCILFKVLGTPSVILKIWFATQFPSRTFIAIVTISFNLIARSVGSLR